MRRLRFFRALLPAALVLFLILLFVSLRDRPAIHGIPTGDGLQTERSATGVRAVQIVGGERALDFEADVVEPRPDGGYHLEMIKRLGIAREGKGPLVVQALGADIESADGGRRIVAREDVVVRDPEDGLVLRLPRLEIDEAAGEARSTGEVVFEGAGSQGRASRLVYGLAGQPSELFEPVLEDGSTGVRLRADKAVLLDGLDDVELRGGIEGLRGDEHFEAGALRLRRDEEGRLRQATAREDVRATVRLTPDSLSELAADRMEADWDELRRPRHLALIGNAHLARPEQSVSAKRIEALRAEGSGRWTVTATGTVYARGRLPAGLAWMRTDSLAAELDEALEPLGAEAAGHVRFEAPDTRAEADRAEFDPSAAEGQIRLYADGNRKARLSRLRTRVAAERISTDSRGVSLTAERRVEATLMPERSDGAGGSEDGLFRTTEAIHFVAAVLHSRDSGARLLFREGVRGWQGERNLSADEIELLTKTESLRARGNVTTRIPRVAGGEVRGEADFVQVAADRLEYDGARRVAVYEDHVRITLVEGWIEAARIEIELQEGEGTGIREVRAMRDVRIEFTDPDEQAAPQMVSGTADRVSYVPQEQTVRLFGDERPATVRRLGPQGATTSGRVLRYRLDVGTLEVESGEQAPARIRGR